jgi:isoleucyl-tRNA synthetase
MSTKPDFKHTLNLPKTDFPMKADLPRREPLFLQEWRKLDLYNCIQKKPERQTRFILHDGPPYANGDIHCGHVLNKVLKDIVVKYKAMRGFDVPFVPGWDCHGLPVEHQLFKELGINKYQINQLEFRKKAYAYALRFVAIQKEQFQRLGVFGDWENAYLTLNPEYEESIVSSFSALVKKGYVYRGLKPVNWCYRCETALAEAEVEYEDHSSPSLYVKFKLKKNSIFKKDIYLVIWTTTPWTLIANVAVAVHPDFSYSHYSSDQGDLIIAECREQELSLMGIKNIGKIGTFKGKDLEGIAYEHPFGFREGKVVLADYVSREEGSGLVHTAPGHGNEDYLTGLKYKLDVIMPVDTKGNFDSTAGEFKGLNVYDANSPIIEKLKNLGLLLRVDELRHSYPHCWRCKNPIIFRATKQWFLNVDHKDLRKKLLKAIQDDISWIPQSGRERILGMVSLRPDWCLSRQRYWGVPIPAVVCKKCGEESLEPAVIDTFGKFVREEGTDCWFQRDIKDFLTPGLECPQCSSQEFSKGVDILDVWFDSGVSHQAVLKKRKELSLPASLYLEGSDQHRGWFQSSLIPSMCIDSQAPFKAVLTHGFVVDGEGRKMSKSLGNVISPLEIMKENGADILRLWVASSDYNEDVRISEKILSRLAEGYRKIRNTCRFILSNLFDFNPDRHKLSYEKLHKIDQWILWRLEQMLSVVTNSYESFEFYKAYKAIYDFCNEDLSMYYLDMVKGRLYTYAADSVERRAAQTSMYETLNVLTRILAPMVAFTADEIWQHMPKEKTDSSITSVHLATWPRINPVFAQENLQTDQRIDVQLRPIIELIPDFTKALEDKRNLNLIGSSFDAKINILTKDKNRYNYLDKLKADLAEILKVSAVNVIQAQDLSGEQITPIRFSDIAVEVLKADGIKCQRCWNYTNDVGLDRKHPNICQKCVAALAPGKEQQ